jgi:hypothetical protein
LIPGASPINNYFKFYSETVLNQNYSQFFFTLDSNFPNYNRIPLPKLKYYGTISEEENIIKEKMKEFSGFYYSLGMVYRLANFSSNYFLVVI